MTTALPSAKVVARYRLNYRGALGLALAVVIAACILTAPMFRIAASPFAWLLVALGIGLWLRNVTAALTFGPTEIRFTVLGGPRRVWELDGRTRVEFERRKVDSRWGLAKPGTLVLRDRVDRVSLVDGVLSQQTEWAAFLLVCVRTGTVPATDEAVEVLQQYAGS